MLDVILKFASFARSSGMRISTSEVLDCMGHLQLIDVLDEDQVKISLRSNFVKTVRDQQKFDRLFHQFFHEMRDAADATHPDSLREQAEKMMAEIRQNSDGIEAALFDFLADNPLPYLQELQEGTAGNGAVGQAPGGNMGGLVKKMGFLRSLDSLEKEISRYLQENWKHIPWEARQDLRAFFGRRLKSARNLLDDGDARVAEEEMGRLSEEQRLAALRAKPFQALTPQEVAEMREVIQELVRKLKDTVRRRAAQRSRGTLDIKRTLRRSARTYGVPVEVIYRKRIPHRGKLVVLCDVSGSVWSAARFMLNMLYSLQECFTKVRSYVFVADLDEVTGIFERYNAEKAVDKVLREANIDYSASTDYGRTLRRFKARYMEGVNKKTTVIIIGDARSNYADPEVDIFREISEKSRRLIWLNTESPNFWCSGDSEVGTYRPWCNEHHLCQNLNQLHTFIKELVI